MPHDLMIPPVFEINTSIRMDKNHTCSVLYKDPKTKSLTLYMLLPTLHMAYYYYIDIHSHRTKDTYLGYLYLYTVA